METAHDLGLVATTVTTAERAAVKRLNATAKWRINVASGHRLKR